VHHLEPNVEVVLIEPPSGDCNTRADWAGDGQIDDTLTSTGAHNPEDCGPDNLVGRSAAIVGPIREEFELQLGALGALDCSDL
jgi:hypothetical protein